MYDVYQTYINPFTTTQTGDVTTRVRKELTRKRYVKYNDRCIKVRYVTIAMATVATYVVSIVAYKSYVTVRWLYFIPSVLCGSCVGPVMLSVTWHRTSKPAVTIGVLAGLVAGVATWAGMTATRSEAGFRDFTHNTS